MRTAKQGGRCHDCGRVAVDGLFWRSEQHDGRAPVETWDRDP
jgi:hypothetical protein